MPDHPIPSNRSFGMLFAFVFALLAVWQGWTAWFWIWSLLAVLTFATTILRPSLLSPANRAWMKLGHLLGRVVSPIMLGVVYAVLIIPVGFVMRIIGRDIMYRRFTSATSYWVQRKDPGFSPEQFTNQF